MLIRCTKNKSELFANWWQNNSMPLEEILAIGKYYTVYGITVLDSTVFFEILTIHRKHTFSYPSILFEVIDNRLSKMFCFGSIETGNNKIVPFISFKEWVNDKKFYSGLIDGEEPYVTIFNKYINLLELEYKFPEIHRAAVKISDNWVQCPECTEAWELENQIFEMCVCPKCKTILLNPYAVTQVTL